MDAQNDLGPTFVDEASRRFFTLRRRYWRILGGFLVVWAFGFLVANLSAKAHTKFLDGLLIATVLFGFLLGFGVRRQ